MLSRQHHSDTAWLYFPSPNGLLQLNSEAQVECVNGTMGNDIRHLITHINTSAELIRAGEDTHFSSLFIYSSLNEKVHAGVECLSIRRDWKWLLPPLLGNPPAKTQHATDRLSLEEYSVIKPPAHHRTPIHHLPLLSRYQTQTLSDFKFRCSIIPYNLFAL